MNKKIYFMAASFIFFSAAQLTIFMPEALAQVADKSNRVFSINQRMKIDDQFKLLELKVSQQQKDAWSDDLFGQGNSSTMKLENLQTIRLSEDERRNSGSDDGLEVISF